MIFCGYFWLILDLDWRCFEYYQIDRNEFHICSKSRKNLKNKRSKNFKEKKIKIQPCGQATDYPLTSPKLARCSRPLNHRCG